MVIGKGRIYCACAVSAYSSATIFTYGTCNGTRIVRLRMLPDSLSSHTWFLYTAGIVGIITKENCWYGYNCRTQTHNYEHSSKLNVWLLSTVHVSTSDWYVSALVRTDRWWPGTKFSPSSTLRDEFLSFIAQSSGGMQTCSWIYSCSKSWLRGHYIDTEQAG